MRSKLSYMAAACLVVAALLAASGCASNSANANGANAASSSAASGAADQSTAAQSNAQGAAASNAPAGQAATAPGGTSAAGATTAPGAAKDVDACALLTSDDIKVVQGEAVKESKPSRRDEQSLRVSQCFFTTATFNKSVSLEATTSADGKSARRFWDERFERARAEAGKGEREREREKRERDADKKKAGARGEEDEEESALPTQVKGIGDEAYWAASRVNGTLYARKGDSFVRVSVGGTDSDAERLRKAKALAQKALARL